ncbi:MAG TPA: caspase family protein [Thermoanaerobaculia bacterium]
MRSSFLPGTLVLVSAGDRDRVAMSAEDFLGASPNTVVVGHVPDTTLAVDYALNATGSVNAATPKASGRGEGTGGATLHANLKLHNIETLTLPLDKVRDLVEHNERVRDAIRRSPDNIFIVLDALRVNRLEFSFGDRIAGSGKGNLPQKVLSPLFAGELRFGADGVLSSDTPVVVGASLAKLSLASTVLGGGPSHVTVAPVTPAEIHAFRARIGTQATRLYSGFDVYGMVIGLGNYPAMSTRIGGSLPDAVDTAQFVTSTFRRLLPPSDAAHIRTLTSEELSRHQFDATQRLGRREILDAIDDFVRTVKRSSDPTRETLIVFYFFGHGLADGISKSVFLVPETFVDDEQKSVADLAGQLVSVEEVTHKLGEVSDHTVLFIDACRAHQDEAAQLTNAWQLGLQQGSDVKGILGALQFASGIYGPTPMLFASADGVAARTVALPTHGIAVGTGPLAAGLAGLFDDVATNGGTLDLEHFLLRMQQPRRLGVPAQDVRGYTFMREDFVKSFGGTPLLSADPQDVALRPSPFRPPEESFRSRLRGTPPSTPSVPSNAHVTAIGEIERGQIQQVAAAADGSGVWIIDEGEQVFEVGSRGRVRQINPGLPLMSIAWDRRLGLLGAQWDVQELYRYWKGEWQSVRTGIRPLLLTTNAQNEAVAIVQRGVNKYGFVAVTDTGLKNEGEITAPEFLDAAAMADGTYWIVEAGRVERVSAATRDSVDVPLARPTIVTASGNIVYVLSEDGRFLYRLRDPRHAEQLDMADAGLGDAYVRTFDQHGLRVLTNGTALVALGKVLVRVDLRDAHWLSVPRTRAGSNAGTTTS